MTVLLSLQRHSCGMARCCLRPTYYELVLSKAQEKRKVRMHIWRVLTVTVLTAGF